MFCIILFSFRINLIQNNSHLEYYPYEMKSFENIFIKEESIAQRSSKMYLENCLLANCPLFILQHFILNDHPNSHGSIELSNKNEPSALNFYQSFFKWALLVRITTSIRERIDRAIPRFFVSAYCHCKKQSPVSLEHSIFDYRLSIVSPSRDNWDCPVRIKINCCLLLLALGLSLPSVTFEQVFVVLTPLFSFSP